MSPFRRETAFKKLWYLSCQLICFNLLGVHDNLNQWHIRFGFVWKRALRNPMSIVNVPAILGGAPHFRRQWFQQVKRHSTWIYVIYNSISQPRVVPRPRGLRCRPVLDSVRSLVSHRLNMPPPGSTLHQPKQLPRRGSSRAAKWEIGKRATQANGFRQAVPGADFCWGMGRILDGKILLKDVYICIPTKQLVGMGW